MGTLQVTLTEERGAWGSMFQKESHAEKPIQNIKGSLWLEGFAVARHNPLLEEGPADLPVPRISQPGSRNKHTCTHHTPPPRLSLTHTQRNIGWTLLPARLEANTTHTASGLPPRAYIYAKSLLCTTCW